MTVKELSQLYWLNREIESDRERLLSLDILDKLCYLYQECQDIVC